MQFTTVKFAPRRRGWDFAAAILLAGGASFLVHATRIRLCPLKRLTGLPCPTCGTTRALLSLAGGNVADAWSFNPLAAAVFSLLGLYLLTALAFLLTTGRIPVARASRKTWFRLAASLLLLAALNWLFMMARAWRSAATGPG